VLGRLKNTLDLSDDDDLRAGALLAVLCAGVRKNELCGLDVGDLREVDGRVALSVRRLRPPSRAKQRLVLLSAETSAFAATLLGASALDAATVRRAVVLDAGPPRPLPAHACYGSRRHLLARAAASPRRAHAATHLSLLAPARLG